MKVVLPSASHCMKGRNIISKRFKDRELYIRVPLLVRKEVTVVANTNPPAENLLELLLVLDALKRQKKKVNLIIPYFGYARQDRVTKKGEALSAEVVGRMIASYKPSSITIIDAHSERLKSYLKFRNISALPLLLKKVSGKNAVVVSPDKGSIKRAKKAAQMLRCPFAWIEKRRLDHNVSESITIHGDVRGKNTVIVDDMLDTGGTIIHAAKLLKKKGARNVSVVATLVLFSGNAIQKLEEAPIQNIYVTDTLPRRKSRKIKYHPITEGTDLYLP